MNEYLIPIADIDSGNVWIEKISANSISDCQDKIIDFIIDQYEIDESITNYYKFIEVLDSKYNILIGTIQDIETI